MKRLLLALFVSLAAALSLAWYSDWFSLGYHLLTVRFSGFDGQKTALDLANYRVAIDAVEAFLRNEPPGMGRGVLVGRYRRPLGLVDVPRLFQPGTKLSAGLDQKGA